MVGNSSNSNNSVIVVVAIVKSHIAKIMTVYSRLVL